MRTFFSDIFSKYEKLCAVRYIINNQLIEKSYYELYCDVMKVSKYFITKGTEIRVGLIGKNTYEWIVIFLGTMYANGTVIPIDSQLDDAKICELLNLSDANFVVVDGKIKKWKNGELHLGSFDDCNEVKDLLKELCEDKKFFEDEKNDECICLLLFTSGTSGEQKCVELTNVSLRSDCEMVYESLSSLLIRHKVIMNLLPMYHAYAIMVDILLTFYSGNCLCICRGMKSLEKDLKIYKPEVMFVVPMILEFFAEKVKNIVNRYDFPDCTAKTRDFFGGNLAFLVSGGAPISEQVVSIMNHVNIDVYLGYGMTECSPVISVMNAKENYDKRSVGSPLKCNEVRIKNGEIQVKGKNVMKGYYRDKIATDQVMDEGWLKTGDTGYINENGHLYVTGRIKNIIILSNGENIAPQEIEDKVKEYLEIEDVIVFEDKIFSSSGKLSIGICVSHKGEDVVFGIEQKIQQLNVHQPLYKRINGIYVTEQEFIRTSTYKINRKETVKMLRRETICKTILNLLRENINNKGIQLSTNIHTEVEIDSLHLMIFLGEVEEKFEIELYDEDIRKWRSVLDIINCVETLIEKR